MTANVDVTIVGAGVIGMSIAWHLGERGIACTVYDGKGIGAGMTGLQPGGVRTQWSSDLACRMALESREFYDRIGSLAEDGHDPEFDACGYAFAASSPKTLAELQADVTVQNTHGIPSRILTADELADLVPGIDASVTVGGAYNARDGYFGRPGAVVTAFAEAAARAGVRVSTGHVDRLRRSGSRWQLDLRGGSTVSASAVVIAAGADSPSLLDEHSSPLPVRREARYLFYSNRITPYLVRPLVVFTDEHFAVKHLADGSVLASDLTHGQSGQPDEARWRKEVTAKARRLIPLLEHVRYPVMVEGTYDVTPDHQPVLGAVPDCNGLYVAAGMNGRGMMMAPSIGRMVSEAIERGGGTAIPDELSASRFTSGRTGANEARVI